MHPRYNIWWAPYTLTGIFLSNIYIHVGSKFIILSLERRFCDLILFFKNELDLFGTHLGWP